MHHHHDDEDDQVNRSGNRPFADVLSKHLSRRDTLKGGLAAAVTTGFLGAAPKGAKAFFGPLPVPLISFQPVTLSEGGGPMPVVSPDYEYDVLIPWGDPIVPGGPAFSYPPSPAEQSQQIGIGHDGMWFFPKLERRWGRWKESNTEGYLCINHEYGDNTHVFGKSMPESADDVLVSQLAHGVSVLALAKVDGKWQVVDSPNARRIHVNTPVKFSGPVAESALLENAAGNAPMGTANNCASGHTPWGTYLTCEENFNGYFGTEDADWTADPRDSRYGFSSGGFGYGWHLYDPRFDLADADYANERHRFGWVVEIDPDHPDAPPVKRTALGRFKHEGAEVTVGKGGRVIVYMGDDETFDYVYKFVSRRHWRAMKARGQSPLDEGTLYVAKFNDDGTGEWLELSTDNPDVAAVFGKQEEVLTFARQAADAAGATPMDRPEWASVAPDGWVYITMTNNSNRTVGDAANPLAPNPDGHIIRFRDAHDHVGTTFEWEIFLIAQETHGTEESFADPDGIWADPDGRIFIQTDGGQKDGLENQMLVADSMTGEIRRLLTGVPGCEVTGVAVTPDRKTMFANIQHPGNGDPSETNFPAPFDGITIPRDATLVITKKDGDVIGS